MSSLHQLHLRHLLPLHHSRFSSFPPTPSSFTGILHPNPRLASPATPSSFSKPTSTTHMVSLADGPTYIPPVFKLQAPAWFYYNGSKKVTEKRFIIMYSCHTRTSHLAAIAAYYVTQLQQILLILQELFSKERATGSMFSTCNGFMRRKEAKDQDDIEPTTEQETSHQETSHEEMNESNSVNQPSPHPDRVAFDERTNIKSGSKRKLPKFEEMAVSMLVNSTNKLDDIVNCMKHSNQSMDSYLRGDIEMNDNAYMNLLEELKQCGVSRHRLANAYVALGSNKEKAKLFYSAPEELRLEVLNALMDSLSS